MDIPTDAGFKPVAEAFTQKSGTLPDNPSGGILDKLRQLPDTERTYTFNQMSELLEVNESTLRKRWWEKLEVAYRHCPQPLRQQVRISSSGKPMYEFTEFGLQAFREYKAAVEEGLGDRYLQAISFQFAVPEAPDPPEPETLQQEIAVDPGNHQIVLATPDLPQEYSLETLRTTESITLEDPLAIAQQFIQIADLLVDAMDSDIQQRETKLKQTQKAKETIATKAGELKLEQRLYRERTRQLDTALTDETASLQDALKTLQTLGKSSAGAA